jgi:tRNA A-37 threonylcarbamoyl transferase component Bud32
VSDLIESHVERAAAPRPAQLGDRVGPYRLVKLLGAGAVGSVFEVEHERLGRRAALKLLDPELGLRPSSRARFFAEALAVNRIHNPHIVEVTDVVETEDRQALVMELLDGHSLATVMAAGPLPPERFLPILAEVCEGLAAAHAAGFVHRDLKPDNIFLCVRGDSADFVKVLDFGLATTFAPASISDVAVEAGRGPARPRPFVGTPAYVSPEQASGASVNHATDVYAVGVILNELIVGRVPFEGASLGQYLIQHVSAPVPRLPARFRETALGRTLDVIVQRCMAKDPGARFTSAGELAATFAALGRGELPVVASVTAIRERRRRFPRLALVAAALAFAAGAVVVGLASRPRLGTAPAPTSSAFAPTVDRGDEPAAAPRSLSFESVPAGAEVRAIATGELLGVTPFRRAFTRTDAVAEVEFARAGFTPARRRLPPTGDGAVRATLEPSAAHPPSGAGAKRPRRLDVEKTIDPFRN